MDVLQQSPHHFEHSPTWYERNFVHGPSHSQISSFASSQSSTNTSRYSTFKQRVQQLQKNAQCTATSPIITVALPRQPPAITSKQDTEHMLRRKTPNGTLTGGYDGRPSGWDAQAHVSKHFVVPALTAAQRQDYQLPTRPLSGNTSFRGQHLNSAEAYPWNTNHHVVAPRLLAHDTPVGGEHSYLKHVEAKSIPKDFAMSADPILYQQPYSQQRSGYPLNQYIPTALQPMWPPCIGATSMNVPGPTGPYWPNGAYEPYRPAPFQNTGLPHHGTGSSYSLQGVLAHDASVPGASYRNVHSPFHSEYTDGYPTHIPVKPQALHSLDSYYEPSIALSHSPSETALSIQSLESSAPSYLSPNSATELLGSGFSPRDVSDEDHFKDRILVWAHKIYCNLLSTLNTSPRISPMTQAAKYRRRHQPLPYSQRHASLAGSPFFRKSYNDHVQDRLSRRSSDIHQSTTARIAHSFQWGADSPAVGPTFQGLPYRARNLSLGQLPSSGKWEHPAATAANAMELLGKLCQESEWRWHEGILLGGCLAYGLGDYSSAQKWYTRLLSRDSNHVEAMSNLAATCMSLGRPQEAEGLWNRAIKLRPSFFEAVEHLVGLYCENRRSQEAVKVINFVQKSLQDRGVNDPGIERNPSGYMICARDNGRLIALLHGKGNMLYALGDNSGAAVAFEDAILAGCGQSDSGVQGLIVSILERFSQGIGEQQELWGGIQSNDEPVLLDPKMAQKISRFLFPPNGDLPGLEGIFDDSSKKAAVSVISNSLLSLAKIYQDGMSSTDASSEGPRAASGVRDILSLYYLSLSLQPSPSTANNVGILLAGIQQSSSAAPVIADEDKSDFAMPGVVVGSGIWLALKYYRFGLELDQRHAHLYTNLGSLFKDMGQLAAAIAMYQKAVECDGNFDIALANLANAVKDQGKINDAISYYQRAVRSNPDFAEAVCGLSNALNSVCDWAGRGGIKVSGMTKDRWHIDDQGMLYDAKTSHLESSGWIARVVVIVDKQLREGEVWGKGFLQSSNVRNFLHRLEHQHCFDGLNQDDVATFRTWLERSSNAAWEGARVVRVIERAIKCIKRRAYRKKHIERQVVKTSDLARPQLPFALTVPGAPTVLPFHTFTCPLDARQIRRISQRNGLRISCSTLKAPWLPSQVYEAPHPPNPHLNVGYVSSDFNNHPLAHLMQSVFGLHHLGRVKAFCYATTASDGSVHREQIEKEAPVFYDASSWSAETLVNQIVRDQIHILINLNGYTRGARNEIFAARPSPIQMSFMGFAGTLGAEWCDYLLADNIAIPPSTLRPNRRNVELLDICQDGNNVNNLDDWMYGENIIFTRDTFFCCDHRQSAPDAKAGRISWVEEQDKRWKMRKELFPHLPDDVVILANFNQLYKIDPGTFRTWLRILSRVPKGILWLLRFPELGEHNLRQTALRWVGEEVANRVVFTDVAPKHQHITRATICDIFLDTPECNAHTTAADVLWSGTPLLTLPRYDFKMCSRMAASILRGALPKTAAGDRAASTLIVSNEEDYEERAVELASGLVYPLTGPDRGTGKGQLSDLRRLLYESRWTSALFDTKRWVTDLEDAYEEAWSRWVAGKGGDIVL